MWRALLLAGALATAWLGCASLTGLSGGSSADAGADVTSGPDARDAPAESATDAYIASDASDAGSAADAADAADAAVAFCASLSPAPQFCDDFDEGTALTADWTYFSIVPPDAGTIVVDTGVSFSPPASLAAQVGAGTADPGGLVALITKQFPTSAAVSAHLEYRLRIDAVDSVENELFSQLGFNGGGASPYILDVYLGPGAVLEEEIPGDAGVTFKQHALAQQPQVGVWSLLVLDVDLQRGTVQITVDGALAFQGALDPGYEVGPPLLVLGTGYYAGAPRSVSGGAAHFDNVVLDYN